MRVSVGLGVKVGAWWVQDWKRDGGGGGVPGRRGGGRGMGGQSER